MHSLEYASPSRELRSRWLRFTYWDAVLTGVFLLLSGLSFWVVVKGANDEPYAGPIRSADGFVQVGLGCVLIFAWLEFAVLSIWLVVRRRALPLWPAALIWGLICCGYVAFGVKGYLWDLKTYHQPV